MTALGNRVLADIIKVKMWSLGWTLIQYDWHPFKKKKTSCQDTHTHKENGHGEMEVETGVTLYKPRNAWSYSKLEKPRKEPPLRLGPREQDSLTSWFCTLSIQNCERTNVRCFKSPSCNLLGPGLGIEPTSLDSHWLLFPPPTLPLNLTCLLKKRHENCHSTILSQIWDCYR